ncbi:sulfotransferase family protein [Novosphingobium soli]|uniref:Sulfotransferase n=1 Tax=Novosphingobium soli TaxID=574956 RepID=A0ABV6CX99_9SPHN
MRAIFIIGCPRSGTTLLQSLLACVPGSTTFKESHLFSRSLAHIAGITVVRRNVNAEISRFREQNQLPTDAPQDRAGALARMVPAKAADAAMRALIAGAEARDCDLFLEKTPRHLHFVDSIAAAGARCSVETRFIHLIRDGVAVAASLNNASQHWSKTYSAVDALTRWQKDIDLSVRYLSHPRHSFVAYERLAERPEEESLRLASELGVSLTIEDLAGRASKLTNIVRSDESWKAVDNGTKIAVSQRAFGHLDAATLATLEHRIDRSSYARIVARTAESAA